MSNRPDDDTPKEVTAPACSRHEAGDAYLGNAGKGELVTFINGLLEAESARALVAPQIARGDA